VIDGKRVLALIPARGGSKGLPGKNIRNICGKPLIVWSIDKAKKSKYLDYLMVSTDCPEIARLSKLSGAEVPFIRPKELATDFSTTYDVIHHAYQYLQSQKKGEFDYLVLLEPTSPLREDDDIDNMLEKLVQNEDKFDSIISVGEIDEHPSIVKRCVDDNLTAFCAGLNQSFRRQDNEPAYFPYGVAYIAKVAELLSQNTFYTQRSTYFELKKYQNFEIDDIYGFLSAEAVMRYQWGLE
jgi:CMP-N-acetylneuraminic acid synthetase